MGETDWTSYYKKCKSSISVITLRYIINVLNKFEEDSRWRVMELGVGRSCFATGISNALMIEGYDVIDKCMFVIKMAQKDCVIRNAMCLDLTQKIDADVYKDKYNLVHIVGLVKHFSDRERRQVIENHINLCERRGMS